MMRLRRRNGSLEELTLWPSVGTMFVRIAFATLVVILLLSGAAQWAEILPVLRVLLK